MKVVGFGDNVADVYLHTGMRYPGGNAVNFAAHARLLGIPSAYAGVFGSDRIARFIQDCLQEIGVDTSHCVTVEGKSGYYEVNLVDGDRVFVGGNGGISLEVPYRLDDESLRYLGEFDLIHAGCYANIESELPKLRGLKAVVSFDFSDGDEQRTDAYLERVCPFVDFALFSGSGMSEPEIGTLVGKATRLGVRHVLVTRGAQGSLLYSEGEFYRGAVNPVAAVDTMGAGDAYVTAYLVHYLQNGGGKASGIGPEAIREGLARAADFSAKICMLEGAFGQGERF